MLGWQIDAVFDASTLRRRQLQRELADAVVHEQCTILSGETWNRLERHRTRAAVLVGAFELLDRRLDAFGRQRLEVAIEQPSVHVTTLASSDVTAFQRQMRL